MINPRNHKWFFEATTAVEGHVHAIVRTIVSAQTKFQQIKKVQSILTVVDLITIEYFGIT